MRGLKPITVRSLSPYKRVASFTDAWIETFNPEFDHIGYQSHLLQMRGLKLNGKKTYNRWITSHLLQMRGLKHGKLYFKKLRSQSHLLQMRGLKLIGCHLLVTLRKSHLLQMRGLKPLISL